jgi:hypothetical protein
MNNLEQPKIDVKAIQAKANAAAEKAYLKEIESYYTDYNSPYRQLIAEELKKQEFNRCMDLPDILSQVNKALSAEIDKIANNAIASTYIPMLSKALVGFDKEMNLSAILRYIISELEPDGDEQEDYVFSYEKDVRFDWLNCELITNKGRYEFTFHTVGYLKDENPKYQLLSFPINQYGRDKQTMSITKNEVKIEMPYTPGILEDPIMTMFFKLMLSNTHITMDCDGFDEYWFPNEDRCNC